MIEPGELPLPHVMVDEMKRYGKRRGILNVFAHDDNPQDGHARGLLLYHKLQHGGRWGEAEGSVTRL